MISIQGLYSYAIHALLNVLKNTLQCNLGTTLFINIRKIVSSDNG